MGLTAGLYAAKVHLRAMLLEAMVLGGQFSMTGSIENWPGFPDGIAGQEFIKRFTQKTKRFNLEARSYTKAEKLEVADGRKSVTSEDIKFSSSAFVNPCRSPWDKFGIPGEKCLPTRACPVVLPVTATFSMIWLWR